MVMKMRLDSTYLYAGIDIPLTLAILVGIVAIYTLYLTLRPIFADAQISSKDWNKIEDDSMALIHRRDRLIEELRDLEFEASMSKVDDKDLEELRTKYEREALALIEELDQKASQYQDLIQSQVQSALQQIQSKKKTNKIEKIETTQDQKTSMEVELVSEAKQTVDPKQTVAPKQTVEAKQTPKKTTTQAKRKK